MLQEAGVEPEDVTVLVTVGWRPHSSRRHAPPGATLVVHDPRDRGQLAYLAATKQGRRIYLNRLLTDADVVIPVGTAGVRPDHGLPGPVERRFPGAERTCDDRDASRAVSGSRHLSRASGAGQRESR